MPNPTGKHRPKRRHPGEGTVVRRKDRWRAKPWAAVVPWLDESGRKHTTWLSAASRDEAEALRRAEVERIRKRLTPTDHTVESYVTSWLSTVDVGPGTAPRYKAHLDLRIAPTLGAVSLVSLTPQQVRIAARKWTGAPATRAGTLRLLRAAMKQAVHDRQIEHDPTAGIPYPKVIHKEPVTLTAEEARHLMDTVAGERFGPILVTTLGLGLRRGEALGLGVHDVRLTDPRGRAFNDPEVGGVAPLATPDGPDALPRGSVTIGRALRYIGPAWRAEGEDAYRITGTKTGESRVVPLPGFVADALRDRLEQREQEQRAAKVWAVNDLVFCSPKGNPVPLETLYAWFGRMLKRAGLPHMRWHELRATTVTLLYEMDVPEAIIMAIVGHKDLATTRLYKGRTPKALGVAADKLGEAMG